MGKRVGVRVRCSAVLAAVAVLAALPSVASAATVEKKVGATILFQDVVNPNDGNNCGTQVVIEWKDPTENGFVGSRWVAHYFVSAKETTVSMAPPFHNQMTFLGVDFIATGGNNWWKLGSSHADGGTDEAAQKRCAETSARIRGSMGSQAWVIVTGEEDRSDSAKCAKAEKAFDKAREKVRAARQQVAAAKTDAARARAQQRLTDAIKARARAAAAVGKACNP